MLPLELAAASGAVDTEVCGRIPWNFDGSIDSINEIVVIVELLEVPLRRPLVVSVQYPLLRVFSCRAGHCNHHFQLLHVSFLTSGCNLQKET